MKAQVIKISKARGIHIPEVLLQESGLKDEVVVEVRKNQLVIRAKSPARQGWEEAFKRMAKNRDDQLLDEEVLAEQSQWDKEEWEW